MKVNNLVSHKLNTNNNSRCKNCSILKNKSDDIVQIETLSNIYYTPINFKSVDTNYKLAKTYLERVISEKGIPNSLKDLDLKKIEGIQSGLKIFEGMNIKEIAFICHNLNEIAIYRGCSGHCAHCYANAEAPIKEDDKHINKMSYEDYIAIMRDFKSLRERLGFNPISTVSDDVSLFRDADCLELELKDNNGEIYDFIDLSNIAFDSLGKQILFDTHGWSKSNIKLQKRAEKFVEYFSQPENADTLSQINISINPFNWFNYNVVKALNANDVNKAKILKEAYAKRMANVLFTFTQLLKNIKKFDVIVRSFPDYIKGDFTEGYSESAMLDITYGILSELAKLYSADLKSEKRIVKSEKMILDAIEKLTFFMVSEIETNLVVAGRLNNLIPKNHFYDLKRRMQEKLVDDYIFDINERLFYDDNFNKIIDANGRIYLANAVAIIPTDLALNISNKDKFTAKFAKHEYPALSRKIINSADVKSNFT